MATAIQRRLVQTRFESPVQEAVLSVLLAARFLHEGFEQQLAEFDLTPTQFNVLRILKGVHPAGHPRCEIARRLVERAPDLTRMIDHLERRGLVERARSEEDGRHSIARITRRGLALLERTSPATTALQRHVSRRLTRADAEALSRLCEKLYAET